MAQKRLTSSELDSLMRVLSVSSGPEMVDTRLLESYLAGTTSPEDKERVQRLLAQSGELREELLGLEAISRRTLEFQAMPKPVVPSRRNRRAVVTTPRVVLGLAAALAIAFGLSYGVRRGGHESLVLSADRAYHAEQFEFDPTRGAAPLPDLTPRTYREAALLAFRRVLRWTDGEVTVGEFPVRPTIPDGSKILKVVTPGGARYEAVIPPGASGYRLAVLSLPSLELSWANVAMGENEVRLGVDSRPVLVALVYQMAGGFAANLAYPH